MSAKQELVEFYRSYGEASFRPDEPAYADVCARLGEFPAVIDLICRHLPQARQPNLLFAAVHYLLLGGLNHELAQVHAGTSEDDPAPLFADLVLSESEAIENLLATRSTQTNEVGRSALLAVVLRDAHRQTQQALGWIDLGASGGLNLNLDHYLIDYSVDGVIEQTGRDNAEVRLTCSVEGRPPIEPDYAPVSWKIGIDRSPINVADPDELRWLHACLWPGQRRRHDRLRDAAAIARQFPPSIIEADAVAGLKAALDQAPPGLTVVVTTTWVWYYLPPETKREILEIMAANPRRVLWYSIEGRGIVEPLNQPLETESIESVIGRIASGGGQPTTTDILGHCHAHGASLTWY